jgi:hypothetical protein
VAAVKRSTTVWLYPLGPEHTLPMFFDVLFFILIFVIGMSLDMSDGFLSTVAFLAAAVAFHAAQMVFVFVRFDDTAITIARPWRGRRRFEWSRIAGLVYTHGVDTGNYRGRAPYRLRLVLKDDAPPLGRFLTDRELERYANGPVVMALNALESELHVGPDRPSVLCEQRVYALLAEHGFPKPEPYALKFRTPLYTPDELRLAQVADLKRWRPVTITHGKLVGDDAVRLVGTVLPELARECGPGPAGDHEYGRYATFLFDEQDAADAFLAAARDVIPSHWTISGSALPDLAGPR